MLIETKDQALAATKGEIIAALKKSGISFKTKARKEVLDDLLVASIESSTKKAKPSIQACLFQIFSKPGVKVTEDELKAQFKDVSFTGSVLPWISSSRNPKYTFEGKTMDVQRIGGEDGVSFKRMA